MVRALCIWAVAEPALRIADERFLAAVAETQGAGADRDIQIVLLFFVYDRFWLLRRDRRYHERRRDR